MRYLSLFSGIEAATCAWKPLGWTCAAVAEIEPFPCEVLKHHYPDVPNLGDVTGNGFIEKAKALGPIDVLIGGAPCQAFSVAGLRGGLEDPRGNLTLVYLAVVDAVRPRYIVFENVPGILSALSHAAPDPCPPKTPLGMVGNGTEMETEDEYDSEELHAFNCFLAGLSELGYGFSYGTLDAQYFNLAQRRERVFVVGHLGAWQPAAAVLLDIESMSGNPAPSREPWERAAGTLSARTEGGGGLGTDLDLGGGLSQFNPVELSNGEISHCLNAGGMGRIDYETETLVTHALTGEGFDASEDGTGRGNPLVPVAIPILEAGARTGKSTTDIRVGVGVGVDGDPMFTLQSGKQHAVAVAWAVRRLTPKECCRLQGFPDDYLDILYRGKAAADGPKYRALGNSMAVPVMAHIGRMIQAVDDTL